MLLTDMTFEVLLQALLVHLGYRIQSKTMSLKLICGNLLPKFQLFSLNNVMQPTLNLHTTAIASGKINRMKDRTAMLKTVVKKGDGTVGERSVDLDSLVERYGETYIICTQDLSLLIHFGRFIAVNNFNDSLILIYRIDYMEK